MFSRIEIINKWCHTNKVSSKKILKAVMQSYAFDFDALTKTSEMERVEARCCFIWFCKKMTRLSDASAGRMICRVQTTTSYHLVKTKHRIAHNDHIIMAALWRVYNQLKSNEKI